MPWNNQGGGGGGPWGSPPGGGRNPWGGGTGGGGGGGGFGGPQQPDLEELVRKAQERIKRVLPGGIGGGRGIAVIAAILLVLWGLTGIYRVQPDEQGVVLRFGQFVRTEQPGINYHLPAPIESVLLPKVTRVNRIEVGFRSGADPRRPDAVRDVLDESLMLTGDENIIDIDFVVFWVIQDAGNFLFRIREPEGTIRRVAESAMREIIAQTDIQSALTEGRAEVEVRTRRLIQDTLDSYQAGVEITQVQLLKVDPPAPVIDAFNDVQRARADRERLRNEAEAYRNDILPRARGEAEQMLQQAAAYREQVIALATGDARRFLSVLEAYSTAPEVTARRLYLETMEQVFRGTNKVIIDSAMDGGNGGNGVVPYLPLQELMRRPAQAAAPAPQQPPQAPRPQQFGAPAPAPSQFQVSR